MTYYVLKAYHSPRDHDEAIYWKSSFSMTNRRDRAEIFETKGDAELAMKDFELCYRKSVFDMHIDTMSDAEYARIVMMRIKGENTK